MVKIKVYFLKMEIVKSLKKINKWFAGLGEFVIKFRWGILVFLLIVDIIALFGLSRIKIIASDQGLFLRDSKILENTKLFEEYFGNNDFVALLVESKDVFNPDILSMIRKLSGVLEEEVPLISNVISLTNFRIPVPTSDGFMIVELIPDKIPKEKNKIEKLKKFVFSKRILVNKLFSDDSKQTWIIVYLNPYPEDWESMFHDHPEQVIGKKVTEILNRKEFKEFNIKAAGYPITQYEANQFFLGETRRDIILSVIVTIFLLFLFLRSLRGVLFPLITTFSSIVIVYGFMGYLGTKVNNMVITIPVFLGMAVSIGYSVHIFNFFRYRFRSTGKRKDSILYAMEHTGWPMFFTALTTFGSLLSFTLIPIRILQWMGLTTALIIMVIYLIVIMITPALLSFGSDDKGRGKYLVSKKHSSEAISFKLGKFILRWQKLLVSFIVVLIIISLATATRTRINVDHKTTFGMKLNYIKKAHYIAGTKIGSLYSYNVTIQFPENDAIKDPEILKNLDDFEKKAEDLTLTKRVTSIVDVVKELNMVMHKGDGKYYVIPDKRSLISQLFLLYEMAGGEEVERWVDYDYRFVRVMIEVKDYDTTLIIEEKEFLEDLAKKYFPNAKIRFSGVIYRVAHIQDYIIKGELISFITAMLIILLLMSIVFRSIVAGLIGVIPIVFSSVIVLGVMGLFNIPLNLITMTIIPILLGIGVDDSIHFINHIKFENERCQNYNEAILRSFKAVGYTLFITSFILIAIFSIYATSIVKMFVHFGFVSSSGVLAALVGTYLFIPVMIKKIKPFGKN